MINAFHVLIVWADLISKFADSKTSSQVGLWSGGRARGRGLSIWLITASYKLVSDAMVLLLDRNHIY